LGPGGGKPLVGPAERALVGHSAGGLVSRPTRRGAGDLGMNNPLSGGWQRGDDVGPPAKPRGYPRRACKAKKYNRAEASLISE